MDRRAFLALGAGPFVRPYGSRGNLEVAPWPDGWSTCDWIADIKHGTDYRMLKALPRVDLVFVSPPGARGGKLRLDIIEWSTFDGRGDVLLIPVVRPDPEWHVLGPAPYSVSLWMGPRRRSETASALIEFESPTPVSIYVHQEKIQQVIILTESGPVS